MLVSTPTSKARSAALLALLTAAMLSGACSDDSDVTVGFVEDGGAGADSAPGTGDADAGLVDDASAPAPEFSGEVTCKVSPCVTALSARGGSHICALLSDTTVRCWGSNSSGQLGAETRLAGDAGAGDGGAAFGPYSGKPVAVANLANVTQISVSGGSGGTSCARVSDGSVMCWGANTFAQLGLDTERATPDADAHPNPTRVQGLPLASRVDVAGAFACAVGELGPDGEGGSMYCWGANAVLQLGRGYLPRQNGVAGPVNLRYHRVLAGAGTTRVAFALRDDGAVLSWGGGDWNITNAAQRDALGRESSFSPDGDPREIPGLDQVTRVVAGDAHACALSQGTVYCWGRNATAAVGNSTKFDVRTPVPVALMGAASIRHVAVSNVTTCAVDQRGRAYCWGDNTSGQLGSGDAEFTLNPVVVEGLKSEALKDARVVQIATMDNATCALLEDGSVQCWGSNSLGQLGIGTKDDLSHHAPQTVAL